MNIIDTHAHIYSEEFEEDIVQVIDRAQKAGVTQILLPNIDEKSVIPMHELANRYPNYCLPMMGLHPTSIDNNWERTLDVIKQNFAKRRYIAVGEVGIDLYWDKTYQAQQTEAFEEQLRWSIEYDLPIAIHSRNATQEVIQSIAKVGAHKLRGVFHSFGGSIDEMRQILELDSFWLGINGVATFRNSLLSSVLADTDLSHIVIETDAPYLSPTPYRGKRNEPAYTLDIVNKLASIYKVSPEEVAKITSKNAIELFNIQN